MKRLTNRIASIPQVINKSTLKKSLFYFRNHGLRAFVGKAKKTAKWIYNRPASITPVVETDMVPYLGHELFPLDKPLTGYFTFPLNGLTGIEVLTAGKSKTSGLKLTLKEKRSEKVICELVLDGDQLKDNDYSIFVFEQVPDSADREYQFELEGMSEPHPSVWYNPQQEFPSLKLDIGGSINCRIYAAAGADDIYQLWIEENEPKEAELEEQRKTKFPLGPKISIIVPAFNTPDMILKDMIESVLNQTYANWELCVADGGSTEPHVKEILEKHARQDKRIKVKFVGENKGIVGNSNEALKLTAGDYIALLDHDDTLATFALYEMVKAVNQNPDLDFIYSDRDFLSVDGGTRLNPFFKPDFSPYFLLSSNYLAHFEMFKKEVIDKLGGFRSGFDGAQDYDLALRATELTKKVHHVPKILYHWRKSATSAALSPRTKPYAFNAGTKAISEALERRGTPGEVTQNPDMPGLYRIKLKPKKDSKVSIIIPSRDDFISISNCVDSIRKRTSYWNFEIIIIDNESTEGKTLEYYQKLQPDEDVEIVRVGGAVNFQKALNNGARASTGEFVVFLDDQVRISTREWLEEMLAWCDLENVGAVGCTLLFEDNTIQHAGYLLGADEVLKVVPALKNIPKDNPDYGSMIQAVKEYLAVPAIGMMINKKRFEQAGGFDESYQVRYSDVDLCLRLINQGYAILRVPGVELRHHGPKNGEFIDTLEKREQLISDGSLLMSTWKDLLSKGDPYYNPNLDRKRWDFSIKV